MDEVLNFLRVFGIFVAAWFVILFLATAFIVFLCWLFGRNNKPAQVPNKAVWG
jgi:flagellar biogenesis protein FliO